MSPGSRHVNMTRIFVSYRREDSRHQADRLYDHLVKQFGKEQVFDDVDSIPLGLDFREVLSERLAGCDVFLAVIGDAWLSIAGPGGTRRLDDPGDLVRMEIEAALGRKIPLIPVLVGKSSVPKAEQLPKTLRKLAFLPGCAVRPDPDFHHDVERLIQGIEDIASAKRVGSAVHSRPQSPAFRAGHREPPGSEKTKPQIDTEQQTVHSRKTGERSGAEARRERMIETSETESSMETAPDLAPTQRPLWVWSSLVVGVLMLGLFAVWLGRVFNVKPPDGMIVLDDIPRDSEILVDGNNIPFTWPGDGKRVKIRVVPGQHRVEVSKGGFRTFGQDVTIKGGGSEEVTVHLEPFVVHRPRKKVAKVPQEKAGHKPQGQRALIGNLGNLGGLARWALFVYTFSGVAFMTVAPER